jgi:hypothetical protein
MIVVMEEIETSVIIALPDERIFLVLDMQLLVARGTVIAIMNCV